MPAGFGFMDDLYLLNPAVPPVVEKNGPGPLVRPRGPTMENQTAADRARNVNESMVVNRQEVRTYMIYGQTYMIYGQF